MDFRCRKNDIFSDGLSKNGELLDFVASPNGLRMEDQVWRPKNRY